MKRSNRLCTLLSCLLVACTLLLCACPAGEPPVTPITPPSGDVEYGDGTLISGAGDALADDAAVLTPAVYDEAAAEETTSGNILRALGSKFAAGAVFRATSESCAASADDKAYDARGTVVIAPNGLCFENSENLSIKNMVSGGNVTIESSENLTFENVEIVGDVTVAADAADVTFLSCRLTGANALTVKGTNVGVADSYIGYTACGVRDEGSVGTILIGNRIEGTGTGISSSATGASYTYNTIKVKDADVAVTLSHAANTVAGMNVIGGTQTSVTVSGARNTSVVSNSLISITAENNHAVYICDNAMGGRLTATGNDYFLADGNTYPEDGNNHDAVLSDNTNTNGDTLMDVNERLDVGADENLLPHTDKELFVGMERQAGVRTLDANDGMTLFSYMMKKAKGGGPVILTPGVYKVNECLTLSAIHSDTTFYAHGVYAEAQESPGINFEYNLVMIQNARNVSFKGITLGFEQPSCGQIHVLEKRSANQVRVVTSAGMWEEFSKSDPNGRMNTSAIGLYRQGDEHSTIWVSMTSDNVIKSNDGTMIITLNRELHDMIQTGDILACYLSGGKIAIQIQDSANILFQDMTYYSMGPHPVFEYKNTEPTTYYRVHNTTKPGKILTREEYELYVDLQEEYEVDLGIWIDEQDRYRGPAARFGSTDANHIRACVKGSQVICSIWENLVDDAGNQHSYHSRLGGYEVDGDEIILYYKNNLSSNSYNTASDKSKVKFQQSCVPFRVGDRVFIYTAGGELVCDTEALTATKVEAPLLSNHPDPRSCGLTVQQYSVRVKRTAVKLEALEGYDLTSDTHVDSEKVMVDNRSMASEGFLYDNVLSQNTRTRGILAKAGGTIKNCTFRNCDKIGIAAIMELNWGESGVIDGLVIKNNIIENTSYQTDAKQNYSHAPIVIQGLIGESLDEEHVLCKDIQIVGNKFVNRNLSVNPHAIHLTGVRDVLIEGNDFGCADATTLEEAGLILRVYSCMNIELKDNIYPPLIAGEFDLYVEGYQYKNIFGSDVCDAEGNSFIPDKE